MYTTNPSNKAKRKCYHVAVLYTEVPDSLIGCKDKNKRGSVDVGKFTLHVLCDTNVRDPMHVYNSRKPIQMGYGLCGVCGSRRRRWRELLSTGGNAPQKQK
jgi:hypothetical protein